MNKSFNLAALALLALSACNSGVTDTDGTGAVSFVLTDAASDQVEIFEVDVADIVLTKASGSTVSVLTQSARVDFAELRDFSDLIVGVGLEAGFYSSMTMTLDFTNATVCLVGQTTPATVQDADGNVITGEVDVQVSFPTGARPRVAVARNHMFVLDLDLEQALAVDATSNLVTFSPVVSLSVDPTNPKPILKTGVLRSVNETVGTFTIEKRTPTDEVIGRFTVAITDDTVFQLDGDVATGTAGLATLANLVGSRIWIQGELNRFQRVLTAIAVEGGLGVPGNGQDWIHGHIVARDLGAGGDPTLTVLGRSLDEPGGTRLFNTSHTITLSRATTRVLDRGTARNLDTDALNVGQRITAFGTLTGTALDASSSSGVVRMRRTSVFGVASGPIVNDTLTIDVNRVDLRPITDFDFDVAGNVQADPSALTIDVTGLDADGVDTDDKIRAIGGFQPVDVAMDEDFGARSIVNVSNQPRVMLCLWLPPRADAIPMAGGATSITLDVTNAQVQAVGDGFGPFTLTDSPAPTLEPLLGAGLYTIVERGALEVNTDFATFSQSLGTRISPTSRVARVSALGTFDEAMQVFEALAVTVVLR